MRSTTALLMLAVFGVATAGCSLFLTKGPQLEVQPPPPCTSSVAAPVVDTVLAAASLGLVVVGGLLFSQLVTLYLTPVVYTYMAAIQERFHKRTEQPTLEPSVTPV